MDEEFWPDYGPPGANQVCCWCKTCKGKPVNRKTRRLHGDHREDPRLGRNAGSKKRKRNKNRTRGREEAKPTASGSQQQQNIEMSSDEEVRVWLCSDRTAAHASATAQG